MMALLFCCIEGEWWDAVQIVNFWPEANNATVSLNGSQAVDPSVQRVVLTGPDPYGTNTYNNPSIVGAFIELDCTKPDSVLV